MNDQQATIGSAWSDGQQAGFVSLARGAVWTYLIAGLIAGAFLFWLWRK